MPAGIDSGSTAWMIAATALVLFMTPGLAFFYGGLVRQKNAVSTIMYSFIAMAVVSIIWVLWGYSLAFGPGSRFIGDFSFGHNLIPYYFLIIGLIVLAVIFIRRLRDSPLGRAWMKRG